ncbi:MAG: hypothetical protein V4508_13020 [Pseudomonadota bacterium]
MSNLNLSAPLSVYSLSDAAKILNTTASSLLQCVAFQQPPFDGLRPCVHIVDEVLNDGGEYRGRFSAFCLLETIEIAGILANGRVEIRSSELLARNKGIVTGTLDDEMLHRQPVEGGGFCYEYHPKSDFVVISKDRIVFDGPHLIEFQNRMMQTSAHGEPTIIESFITALEPYIDNAYDELPCEPRSHVDAAFHQRPDYWDAYTRKQRERQINEYDLKTNPQRRIEYVAGWWDATMDASAWWSAESILPVNAAMLLSRYNPNTESIEAAETNSSDEMGPDDFRRLRNIFEGALDGCRTLREWTTYARERGLKIHSWIDTWESWVAEVDTRNALKTSIDDVEARTDVLIEAQAAGTDEINEFGYTVGGAALAVSRKYAIPVDMVRNRIAEAAERGELRVRDPAGFPYTPRIRRHFFERISIADLNAWFESIDVEYRLDGASAAQSNAPDAPTELEGATVTSARAQPRNIWDEKKNKELIERSREAGMTQKKLSEIYGVSRQFIGRKLNEAKPKKANVFSPFAMGVAKK